MAKTHRETSYLTGHFSAHETDKPVLRVSNLGFHYNGTLVLEQISFELKPGERLAVVGPNGAGKSTLFKVIAGVLKPSSGEVQIFGHVPDEHICIAYVPQRSQVDWNFPVNVADVVMMGRIHKVGLFRWPKTSDWETVHHALETVGMEGMVNNQINELSGGQQQRVFIARALAQEAELMLMDEPLTGLDLPAQEDIFIILDKLRQRGVTVLIALHDLKMAAERFDYCLLLNHRLLGFGSPEEVFEPENLMAAYGGAMRLLKTDEGLLVIEDTCCDGGEH